MRDMTQAPPASLALASIGEPLLVQEVLAPAHAPEWFEWLEEIGFLPGEAVRVMARGLPGADPLVIRIGQSTFALRRAEAECVKVSRARAQNA
ncbi:FeoA family protein [Roseateles koreensis]|uniref:FeoA family protein n=1 Tax=Roseateles koreensis TaxID=2987526 RepID=A0ABT5KUA0_9BURK|nr:FeoA family protein [Roseateles koreensis]MDC8786010.1 FeoA family protein [Roseateles koreensis]